MRGAVSTTPRRGSNQVEQELPPSVRFLDNWKAKYNEMWDEVEPIKHSMHNLFILVMAYFLLFLVDIASVQFLPNDVETTIAGAMVLSFVVTAFVLLGFSRKIYLFLGQRKTVMQGLFLLVILYYVVLYALMLTGVLPDLVANYTIITAAVLAVFSGFCLPFVMLGSWRSPRHWARGSLKRGLLKIGKDAWEVDKLQRIRFLISHLRSIEAGLKSLSAHVRMYKIILKIEEVIDGLYLLAVKAPDEEKWKPIILSLTKIFKALDKPDYGRVLDELDDLRSRLAAATIPTVGAPHLYSPRFSGSRSIGLRLRENVSSLVISITSIITAGIAIAQLLFHA